MEAQTIKILVIDDHPFFLEGLKLGLESLEQGQNERYRLDTTTSPLDALRTLRHTCAYDLILCDLNLPEMNGIDFIQKLFRQDSWIPVAIISASENVADISCAIDAGAAGFINKSLNKNELHAALRQLIAGTQYVPPSYARFQNFGNERDDSYSRTARQMGITRKQFQVLTYMSQGLSNQEISDKMSVAISTVKTHTKALFRVLDVSNRTACILHATRLKLLPESHLYLGASELAR